MNRFNEIRGFIETEAKACHVIEAHDKIDAVLERLLDVLHTYKPGVVVKAGLGSGKIVTALVKANPSSYVVVVEPSLKAIQEYCADNDGDEDIQRVHFINGDFQDFPVDYYKADLLVCIDYLNIFDSSKSLDEFRRALQFEGILFLASVVLHNDDTDGIYDEFVHAVFPLHNDYYLEDDLKTFLDLKEFSLIKGVSMKFRKNLNGEIAHYAEIFRDLDADAARRIVAANGELFKRLYAMDDGANIDEPYYIGYFMRQKPVVNNP